MAGGGEPGSPRNKEACMKAPEELPGSARFKLDLMFEGVRYTDALGKAAEHAYPNYYPYRFEKGEHDPTGKGKANIPYLMTIGDGTLLRVKGNAASPWQVSGSLESGYQLRNGGDGSGIGIDFAPLPRWMQQTTGDGFPMARAGVSLHGDMAVVNLAPGCEYFLEKQDGKSMRCTFCAYGAPDERTAHLGQVVGQTSLPEMTYRRMGEALQAAVAETPIHHIYLVGGSLTDWREEGRRFIELARAVQEYNRHRIPVTCGSGALPRDMLEQLHREGLVDSVCFNLEVWSEALFAQICPGKHRFVGYRRWIESLEDAVSLWGRERVYSAMVAGIELEPEYRMDWEAAADLAIRGAEDLCSRGIIPIYSLYWPVGGRDHPEYLHRLKAYFERLTLGYQAIRRKYELQVWEGFMCHQCAYMQLECDMDRAMYANGGER
jgi:hypothetical protein